MFFFVRQCSEFENFLLCERILINVTTCQNETCQVNFKDFKRFGACKGLVEQKTLYSTRSCVNWAFFALVGF
jgi:hypothetical protein